ncbi:hypothetical protein RCL1_006002 [Eukaryota sp. TZLM3-RCL]
MSMSTLQDSDFVDLVPLASPPNNSFFGTLPPSSASITGKPLGWLLSTIRKIYDIRKSTVLNKSSSISDSQDLSTADLVKRFLLHTNGQSLLGRVGREFVASLKRFSSSIAEVTIFYHFFSGSLPSSLFNSFVSLRSCLYDQLELRRSSSISHPFLIDPSISLDGDAITLSSLTVPSSEWRGILVAIFGESLTRKTLMQACSLLRKHNFYSDNSLEVRGCSAFSLLIVMFLLRNNNSFEHVVGLEEEREEVVEEKGKDDVMQVKNEVKMRDQMIAKYKEELKERDELVNQIDRLSMVVKNRDDLLREKQRLFETERAQYESKIKNLNYEITARDDVIIHFKEELIERDELINQIDRLSGVIKSRDEVIKTQKRQFETERAQLQSIIDNLSADVSARDDVINQFKEELMIKDDLINQIEQLKIELKSRDQLIASKNRQIELDKQEILTQQEHFLSQEGQLKKLMEQGFNSSLEELTVITKESISTIKVNHDVEVSKLTTIISEKESEILKLKNDMEILKLKTVEAAGKLSSAAESLQSKSKMIVQEMIKDQKATFESKIEQLRQERDSLMRHINDELSPILNSSFNQSKLIAEERDTMNQKLIKNERILTRLKEAYLSVQDQALNLENYSSEILRLLKKSSIFMNELSKWNPNLPDSLLNEKCKFETYKTILNQSKAKDVSAISFTRICNKKAHTGGNLMYYVISKDSEIYYKSENQPLSQSPAFNPLKQKKLDGLAIATFFSLSIFIKKGRGMVQDQLLYSEDVNIPKLHKWYGRRVAPETMPFLIIYTINGTEFWNPTSLAEPKIPEFPDTIEIPQSILIEKPSLNLVSLDVLENDMIFTQHKAENDDSDSEDETPNVEGIKRENEEELNDEEDGVVVGKNLSSEDEVHFSEGVKEEENDDRLSDISEGSDDDLEF